MIRISLFLRGRLVIFERHAQAGIHCAEEMQRSFKTPPLVTELAIQIDLISVSPIDVSTYLPTTPTGWFNCVWGRCCLFSQYVSLTVFVRTHNIQPICIFTKPRNALPHSFSSTHSYFSREFDPILWKRPSIRNCIIYVTLEKRWECQLYANAEFSHRGTENC